MKIFFSLSNRWFYLCFFYISEVINSAHSQELRLNIFFAILHLENNILQKKKFFLIKSIFFLIQAKEKSR